MIAFNEIRLLVHLSSALFQKPKENGLSAVAVGDWDSCFLVRIVKFEKPYHEFAGHFVVQSLYSGRVTNAFKHELCIGEPVNEDPEWADTDSLNPSQSDAKLSCIDEPGTHDKLRPHFILNVFRKQYCICMGTKS